MKLRVLARSAPRLRGHMPHVLMADTFTHNSWSDHAAGLQRRIYRARSISSAHSSKYDAIAGPSSAGRPSGEKGVANSSIVLANPSSCNARNKRDTSACVSAMPGWRVLNFTAVVRNSLERPMLEVVHPVCLPAARVVVVQEG